MATVHAREAHGPFFVLGDGMSTFPVEELEALLEAWDAFLEALLICLNNPDDDVVPEIKTELEVMYG